MNRPLAFLGAVAGAYAGVSAALAVTMSKRSRRVALSDDPAAVGLDFREVSFPSRRHGSEPVPMLHGWIVASETRPSAVRDRRWVVLVHGDGANRTDHQVGMLALARALHDAGYGILMFDMRGCGVSADDDFTAGWRERLDVLGALDCLVAMGADRSRIAVMGFSLGAVATALACSTPNVAAAVVCEGAFSSFEMMLQDGLNSRIPLAGTLRHGMSAFLKMLYGYSIQQVSPLKALADSEVPVMLIHGTADEVVPVQHARMIARALGIPQHEIDQGESERLWLPEGVAHIKAFRTNPDAYLERVLAFLDLHLAASSSTTSANGSWSAQHGGTQP